MCLIIALASDADTTVDMYQASVFRVDPRDMGGNRIMMSGDLMPTEYDAMDMLLDLTMCRVGDAMKTGPEQIQHGQDGRSWETKGLRG